MSAARALTRRSLIAVLAGLALSVHALAACLDLNLLQARDYVQPPVARVPTAAVSSRDHLPDTENRVVVARHVHRIRQCLALRHQGLFASGTVDQGRGNLSVQKPALARVRRLLHRLLRLVDKVSMDVGDQLDVVLSALAVG